VIKDIIEEEIAKGGAYLYNHWDRVEANVLSNSIQREIKFQEMILYEIDKLIKEKKFDLDFRGVKVLNIPSFLNKLSVSIKMQAKNT